MRDPLILPLVCLVTGVVAGRALGIGVWEAAWPMAAFVVLAMIAWPRNRFLMRICGALAVFFLGIFAEASHRPGAPPVIDAGSKEIVILDGCVVEPTVFSSSREQFTLELDSELKARARVSLGIGEGDAQAAGNEGPPQKLDYGERVEIEAKVRRPHNYNNPGSFDYAGWLARQNIYWTATMARGSRVRVLPGRCGSRFMATVFALRVAALERIEKLYGGRATGGGDNYATGMMEAILIGETSKLEKIWTENFRRTGTFHALVISGVHVTVLAGVLLFLLRMCMMPEIPALAVTAAGAWIYALVSGFSAPVVRAAGGFTLYLAARFFFRRGRVLNLLAAVAIMYLLWDPGQLFDASFQLSFLCVATIGALGTPLLEATSAPLSRGVRAVANVEVDPHLDPRTAQFRVELRLIAETIALWTRLPLKWATEAVALGARFALFAFEMAVISTVIQIGLALPMAEYFHRVSFSGLSANLFIVPLLNAVVPLGFISIFTGSTKLAWVAGWMLKLSARIAEWHAKIEPNWRIPDPPVWLAVMLVASLIVLGIVFSRRRWRWAAMAWALASFALLVAHPFRPAIESGTLELTAIDVGQGDSLLVAFPDGRVMVVDAGGLLAYGRTRKSNLDTGEDVVSPYLWSRGITHIDVLVVTHAHEDHSGGAVAVMENFRPREVWVGTDANARVVAAAARLKIPVIERHAAEALNYGGARIEIVSPPEDYRPTKNQNNDSLAFRIDYGSRSFLLTGDMERPMESRMLAEGLAEHADVLKVGHHGSKTSTTQAFLDAVAPSIGIISAGYENSFGHPNKDVLARIEDRGTAVLRTDLDGLVTVRTDGRRIWMDTMSWRGQSGWFVGERSFNWAAVSDVE